MRELPFFCSEDALVRALISGKKTQDRRTVKWRGISPGLNLSFSGLTASRTAKGWVLESPSRTSTEWRCAPTPSPYGEPGDQLWLQESFARIDGQTRPWIETDYRATYKHGDRLGDLLGIKKRWSPAIHMPRHASRLLLDVTAVRVERLHSISPVDALQEGLEECTDLPSRWNNPVCLQTSVKLYSELWEQKNGPGSWQTNPWVWVTEFQRIEQKGPWE